MSSQVRGILLALAQQNPKVTVVTADMGDFSEFRSRCPGQFLNVGVAEANSISVAAGMAYEGRVIFVYTVAGFTIERAYEQIKYTVGYRELPVVVLGSGIGWGLAQVGVGHHPTNDLALAQTIPNMRVHVPATSSDVENVLRECVSHPGPAYVRLGQQDVRYHETAGRPHQVVCLGSCYAECFEALQGELMDPEQELGLMAVQSLTGAPAHGLAPALTTADVVTVVEDHGSIGGLGDYVRRLVPRPIRHIALPPVLDERRTTPDSLRALYGFTPEQLRTRVLGP